MTFVGVRACVSFEYAHLTYAPSAVFGSRSASVYVHPSLVRSRQISSDVRQTAFESDKTRDYNDLCLGRALAQMDDGKAFERGIGCQEIRVESTPP